METDHLLFLVTLYCRTSEYVQKLHLQKTLNYSRANYSAWGDCKNFGLFNLFTMWFWWKCSWDLSTVRTMVSKILCPIAKILQYRSSMIGSGWTHSGYNSVVSEDVYNAQACHLNKKTTLRLISKLEQNCVQHVCERSVQRATTVQDNINN
jgi:hypothetical protein